MKSATISFTSDEVAAYYRARHPRLKQHGRNWRGTCIIHGGKGPSLSVESVTGKWNCFSACGRGGSLLDFEMELRNASFRDALESVGSLLGRSLGSRKTGNSAAIRAAHQQRELERNEQRDANYFAQAALVLFEPELAKLEPDASERGFWTHIIESLRLKPVAIYRTCKGNDPVSVEAWVLAGKNHESRLHGYLKTFIAEWGTNVH